MYEIPEIEDFVAGLKKESDYQIQLWGANHDKNKTPQDWFWLIGYLSGKALRSHIDGDFNKALHHTITTAAAISHWHEAIIVARNQQS
jgi:hypothetical protein